MTKAQLEEIFDQIDKGEYDPSSQEVILLVEEIERLQERLDDIDELVCTTIIGCGKCTTCKTISQLEEKVKEGEELLTSAIAQRQPIVWENEELKGERCVENSEPGLFEEKCGKCIYCFYKRGAETMRAAAADLFEGTLDKPGLAKMPLWAEFIRSLPIPEYNNGK